MYFEYIFKVFTKLFLDFVCMCICERQGETQSERKRARDRENEIAEQ